MEINLLDLMVKIGIDDKATSGVEKVASKVKGAFGASTWSRSPASPPR